MKKGVIVVDMLRGFLEPETVLVHRWDNTPVTSPHPLYVGEEAAQHIPFMIDKIEAYRASGAKIYFVCDLHERNDREFRMFPPHGIRGTKEAEIIPQLTPFTDQDNVFHKNRYSGFFHTGLHDRLQVDGITNLEVVGVCTDICVLHTVADAVNRDYNVEVDPLCVASFNLDNHWFALDHMKNVLGVRVVE